MFAVPAGVGATTGISPNACTPTVPQVYGMLSQIPKNANLLLNVNFVVTHTADFGNFSLWAIDSVFVSFLAWQVPGGIGYGLETFLVSWRTFQGATSPGAGVVEPKDGSGTAFVVFFYPAVFTFTPGSMPTHGYIGSFDQGVTKANILLGSYALQTIPPPIGQITSPPLAAYFNNDGGFYYLGFSGAEDYFFQGQLALCAAYTGSAFQQVGDIIT